MQFSRLLRRSCKDSSAYNNPANSLGHVGSNLHTAIASIAATGLILSSAGFGAVYAWASGAEHGSLLASLMVMMAVALELAKPLAVASAFSAFRSWAVVRGAALALLALVAIAYSLTAELQLVATSRGDVVARREATIEQRDDRRDSVKAARAELATLAPSRSVAEVQADVVKVLADNPKAGDCSKLDGPVSRFVCPQVATLRGEIARAERRAELQGLIGKATNQPAATAAAVKNADPGSTALATYLATIGISVSATRLTDWLVLVPVIALELGAALALLLVQSVSSGQAAGVATGQQTASVTEQKADTGSDTQSAQPDTESRAPASEPGEKRTPQQARKRTRKKGGKGGPGGQSGKRRLGNVVDLLKARGGQIKGGQREIAKALRLSKSRVNEMLHEAAAAGIVRLATSRSGTTVALTAA